MIIKPSIRSNFFTNAHPLGCEQFVVDQIHEAKSLPEIKGPKNVLIIGGSSGYGLASRIALAFSAQANTLNVSYESGPRGKRTGSAGWWNNVFFQKHAAQSGHHHHDLVGDAFSRDMKAHVADLIKRTYGKIDLLVYSLASGARKNEQTGETIMSHIKTIGEPLTGKTIDVAKGTVDELTVTPASSQEIADTVFVMGGSDWQDWVNFLDEAELLDTGFKTVSYTYIGGETTEQLYRGGTLGKAKEDLEAKADAMDIMLKKKYQGEAIVSSSKAVITKASVFIPQMPIYVSSLLDVMKRHGVHETILEHKHRLFRDMLYGKKRDVDSLNRLRLDRFELSETVQEETYTLMRGLSDAEIMNHPATQNFLKEFFNIHGFGYDTIDYEMPVNMERLANYMLR